ncbi:MAG: hypothetical protein KGJ23_01435 [Euryarchaeota archaeon]|nr:hypothetical protein [Euryarchaeota archaeon]MDE1835258.1 hypothetical protein [Euryarchaeota archaeon]MDE2043554.1 hypothetical protein [Thermoplasmata archaeon]
MQAGPYAPQPAPLYGAPPVAAPMAVPPELSSARSFLDLTKLLALIFGILWILGGVGEIVAAAANPFCQALIGCETGAIILGAPLVLFGVFDLLVYAIFLPQLRGLLEQGQYQVAKEKSMIWAILTFIVGGVIIGILLLIFHLKMDPLITWQQAQGGAAAAPVVQPAPVYGQPPAAPSYAPPAPAYAPPAYAPPASPPPSSPPSYSAPPIYSPPPQAPSYATQPPPSYAPPAPAPSFSTYSPGASPPPSSSPAPTPGAPTCRTCGKPTSWIAQYGRYYCYSCSQYA